MSCSQRFAIIASFMIFTLPLFSQSPGAVDSTFGQNGEFLFQPVLPSGGTPVHRNSVLQADGKMVTLLQAPGGVNLGVLARLTTDGSLDSSFGSGGYVQMTWGGATGQTNALAKQIASGEERFVVAGWARCGSKNCLRLERYTSAGALDASFGTGGVATINLATSGGSMAVQPGDQKIVILASSGVMRLSPNGSLDPSFGSNGISTAAGIAASAVAMTDSGRLLLAGKYTKGKTVNFAVARLNGNGSLDTSFATGGRATTDFGGFSEEALWVSLDALGRIVAAGQAQMGGTSFSHYNAVLVRYSADGQIDTTFGVAGKGILDIGGRQDLFKSLAFQADGKIVLTGEGRFAGNSDADILIARYNSNGTIDGSFGNGGWVMKDMYGNYDQAQSILVQVDPACPCEKILIVGGGVAITAFQSVVLRYYSARIPRGEGHVAKPFAAGLGEMG